MTPRRHGKSLIELLVVLATMAVVMETSVRVIHRMLRSQSVSSESLVGQTSLARLAADIRRDAHSAVSAEPATDGAPAGVRCTLRLPQGRVVRYEAVAGDLTRIENQNDKPLNRESYRLPEGETRFELAGQPPIVIATHRWSVAIPGGRPATPHEFRVEAALGADRRFESSR